ncbi:MAG: hypothetical protein R2729_19015 [Bryobacteraceae bacterium]
MNHFKIALASAGLLLAHAASAPMLAAPSIGRIVNNASYTPDGLPGSGIGLGSIFAVFGSELGPGQLTQSDYPLPTTLAGTSLRISVGGAEVSAFIIYTSATQVAAILPSNASPGRALARLTYNGQTSEPFAFEIVRNGPGLFTLNSAGSGPAVLTDANFSVITLTNPARPGQTVIAWATGISPANGPDNERPAVFDPPITVEVFVGGQLANVRFRGRAPCCAGLDQIVFDIPANVSGCSVSLAVRAGGNTSNFSSIAVAPQGQTTCSDPNGFSSSDLNNVPAGGFRMGVITLQRSTAKITAPVVGTVESQTDIGAATFTRFEPGFLVRSRGLGDASFGSCAVYSFQGEASTADPVPITFLDAGAQLTITGPGGSRTMTRQQEVYSGQLGMGITGLPGGIPGGGAGQPLFLNAGDYSVAGAGGRDVGAFTARIRIPQRFNWTNQDATTRVQRSQDLTLTWEGGDPPNEYVTVSGSSSRSNPRGGVTFYCTGPASAGRLVVPSVVLSALPPSENIQGTPTGTLLIYNAPTSLNGRFSAPGIDLGVITYGTSFVKNLPYE